jgi:hypothetical protein
MNPTFAERSDGQMTREWARFQCDSAKADLAHSIALTHWKSPPPTSANLLEVRGADTGLKPAQTAHSANPAQRKINEIVKTKGAGKLKTCSIPAPGTK